MKNKLKALNEFTLWLEPEGEEARKIRGFITKIQKQTGTVGFLPHVTLLGGIKNKEEALTKLEEIRNQKSIRMIFNKINTSEKEFQSIYLESKNNKELMKLNNITQKLYSTNKKYSPHMSILYGKLDDNLKKMVSKVILDKGLDFFSFTTDKISLWHAYGTAEKWVRIKRIRLKN